MRPQMQIAGRQVGGGQTFIIAEIGVNHDGSVDRAMELVDVAAQSGADAVKLQVFRARQLLHGTSQMARYQIERTGHEDAMAMLRQYELTDEQLQQIVMYAWNHNIIPLATPFSPPDVSAIEAMGLPAIKIASPDLVNKVLLKRAAATAKPLIISTGAATLDEVTTAVRWLCQWKSSFALLHCVSSYPTPPQDCHLHWIEELSTRFGVPVGFSDHTQQPHTGAMAVAAGASIIEKHITYDRSAPGPDHACSAAPEEFRDYVRQIRAAERLCGEGSRRVLLVEQDVRKLSRQSLVALVPLPAGEPIREEQLTCQRPGTGIPAGDIDRIIGRRPAVTIAAGDMLDWTMFAAAEVA